MSMIAERNMLLRKQIELPVGLRLATDEFREGWNFVQSADAKKLEKKVQSHGWNLLKIADGTQACGVGETSEEAVSSALRLALLRMSAYFNAVEIEYIELTQYPWFFLARVRVCQYRVQQSATQIVSDESIPLPSAPRRRRLPLDAEVLYPGFGSSMPQIKEMLVSSRPEQMSAQ
jgi:hypothetical protein